MWKKILRRELWSKFDLLKCLFLGVALNIAVVCLVVWIPLGSYRSIAQGRHAEDKDIYWSYQRERLGQYSVYYTSSRQAELIAVSGSSPPSWSSGVSREDVAGSPGKIATSRAVGWPLPCFTFSEYLTAFSRTPARLDGIRGGLLISWKPNVAQVIPYSPIWLNLTLNILAWTVLCAVVMFMWRVSRTALRVRQRKCPCGYECQTGICPECGEAVGRFYAL